MRSEARETAFKIVFAGLFHGQTDDRFRAVMYKQASLTEDDRAFAERLVQTVSANKEELLAKIAERVVNFPEYRIYAADRAILLVALAEIFYFEDVPNVVSASEAANLARKYSTEKSADFVNGVLGGIINQ